MTEIHIIAAMARNGTIGRTHKPCSTCDATRNCPSCGGTGRLPCKDVPWNYPEYERHFHDVTMRHSVIMDRWLWESLSVEQKPLPGRQTIVVSTALAGDQRTSLAFGKHGEVATAIPDIEAALRLADWNGPVYVVGSTGLYTAAFPLATHVDLTLISQAYDGDLVFPGHYAQRNAWYLSGAVEVDVPRSPVFERVQTRSGEHPDLTYTQWVRR